VHTRKTFMCFKLIIMYALLRMLNNGFFISRTWIILKRCRTIDDSCSIKSLIKQANFFLSSIVIYFKITQVSNAHIRRSYMRDAAVCYYKIFRDSPVVCKVRAGSRDFKAIPLRSPRELDAFWAALITNYRDYPFR